MRDGDVRKAVRDLLNAEYQDDPDTRIVEEMGIWSGSVRIDIAVINGELQGFELKSARDTLRRLPEQQALYSQVFEKVTLVVADSHSKAARSMLPSWWGVMIVRHSDENEIELCDYRLPKRNPKVDPEMLAMLLWRSEALAILQQRGLDRGYRSKTMPQLVAQLVDRLSLAELSFEVRSILKCRPVSWLGQSSGNEREMAIHGDFNPRSATARRRSTRDDVADPLITPTPSDLIKSPVSG